MWRHLDCFSGIGGFALAAAWTERIETVQFVEIDPWCRRVLAKHWPGVPIHDDIRTFLADAAEQPAGEPHDQTHTVPNGREAWPLSGLGGLDLITGGFPCQPWSAAGKRAGSGDDRDLWPELARVVGQCRPRWGLFENVPGIISMAHGLDRVLADLDTLGYATGTVVIPAAAVGAYHRRDRVWIVAHAQGAERHGSIRDGQPRGRNGPPDPGGVGYPPRRGLRRGQAPEQGGLAALPGQDAADGCGTGLEGYGGTRGTREKVTTASGSRWSTEQHNGHEALRGLGDGPDGLPRRVAGFGPDWEAGIPRVTQHETDRVNKLKALGNAIVPAVAYELLMMMLAADDGVDCTQV
jgi:DNA (cytosine-5)-methyltransferase 1